MVLCIGMLNRSIQKTQTLDFIGMLQKILVIVLNYTVHSLSRLLYIKVPDVQF